MKRILFAMGIYLLLFGYSKEAMAIVVELDRSGAAFGLLNCINLTVQNSKNRISMREYRFK